MHDRGDYKTGWQLEREWDAKAKERQRRLDAGLPEDDVKRALDKVQQLTDKSVKTVEDLVSKKEKEILEI